MTIPRTLYAIAYGDNRLQSTSYNQHYMIYRRRKNAEKALETLKRKYSQGTRSILVSIADKMHIVEYTVKE